MTELVTDDAVRDDDCDDDIECSAAAAGTSGRVDVSESKPHKECMHFLDHFVV